MFTPVPVKPAISAAILEAIDIRLGTIRAVDDVPSSKKLIRLTVDFGDHSRRILAGVDQGPAIEVAVSRFAEVTALEAEVASLTDRLETRKAVERAKGRLMTAYGMTEPAAFKWIQRTAMDHRMTMRQVADRIIEENLPGDAPQA